MEKTKEDILNEALADIVGYATRKEITWDNAAKEYERYLQAMQEYSQSQNAELIRENEELKKEVERVKGLEQRAFCAGYLSKSDWNPTMIDEISNGGLRNKWEGWNQFKQTNKL